jgi:hypothetical protein
MGDDGVRIGSVVGIGCELMGRVLSSHIRLIKRLVVEYRLSFGTVVVAAAGTDDDDAYPTSLREDIWGVCNC